jgi:hypothetical protein
MLLLRILLAAASVAVRVAALATLCVVRPIEICDARTALRSESLTVVDEDRQHAGECKCHDAHCCLPWRVSRAIVSEVGLKGNWRRPSLGETWAWPRTLCRADQGMMTPPSQVAQIAPTVTRVPKATARTKRSISSRNLPEAFGSGAGGRYGISASPSVREFGVTARHND